MRNRNLYNVPDRKIKLMTTMVEDILAGDRKAAIQFEESISTSDAPLAFAAVSNINLLPQYQKAPSIWQGFATRRLVGDFNNVRLIDIVGDYTKLKNAGAEYDGILPVVPELSVYPYVAIKSSETSFGVKKRGLKFGYSWETAKQDVFGFLSDFVPTLANLASQTEDALATEALVTGVTAFSQLAGNPALTMTSLENAQTAIRQRKVNGNPVQVRSFVLVVPPSLELTARTILNTTQIERTIGGDKFTINNTISGITLVVNDWLPTIDETNGDTAWYLVPAPGAGRPSILQAFLAGEEAPELRVNGLQGGYFPGGGDVPWSAGSFDNDAIDFRLRTVGGAGLVSEEAIAWSAGTAAP